MSRLWPRSLEIGFFPDGLTVDGVVLPGAPLERLQLLPAGPKLRVVLSSHYVRYAVLPWSAALRTEEEWRAYAQHHFVSTYGAAAHDWTVRLCSTGPRKPQVACSTDRGLLESLRKIPRVISVQPALSAAFNPRRKAFAKESGWFVIQEPLRLTIGLIADASWKFIRTRQTPGDWREALPDLLDRETAASGEEFCARVVLKSHDAPPTRLERYFIASAPAS